jgi:hypothetical protein
LHEREIIMNNKSILDKFLNAQNQLVIQSSDLSLGSISSMVKSGAIEIASPYQRRERWNEHKKSALIESFLLNIPVPPIYLAEDEYGKYSIIDGKQRITSIYEFMSQGMKLSSLEDFTALEGITFNQLPTEMQNILTIRCYLRVITLLKQSNPNLKYEVFKRLNTGGDILLAQELRNVLYRGLLNDLIINLSENSILHQQLKIDEKNKKENKLYREMVDVEYVLRFFTLRETWKNFGGNFQVAMDKFMEDNQNADAQKCQELKEIFEESISLCSQIWGKQAFMRPSGKSVRNLVVQAFYDLQMVSVSLFLKHKNIIDDNKSKQIRDEFTKEYEADKKFEDSIRKFTSNPENVEYRIKKMNEILSKVLNVNI